MLQLGIETGHHYKPNHKLTLFKPYNKTILKNTEYLGKRLLSLPLHPSLSNKDIKFVSNCLLNIMNR